MINDAHTLVETELSSKQVYDGDLLNVHRDEVRLPDGSTSAREWIKHPGASAILPVFENGDVAMIKQFRYPVRQVFWEVPAGKIDPGEEPGETIKREVIEEAGVTCHNIHCLGSMHPCIGYADEIIYLYVGWGLEELEQQVDDDEFLSIERLPFREVVEMAFQGHIPDGKTFMNVTRAWHWWQQHGPFPI